MKNHLKDKVVVLSGFKTDEEYRFRKLVGDLGGLFSRNLTSTTLCLVIKHIGSEKHKVALERGIPVVSELWLNECAISSKVPSFDNFKPLCFHGVSLCCSNLSFEERLAIKRVVEGNGGTYSSNLIRNATTHLVVSKPEGEKYDHALSWKNVKIVFPSWIHDTMRDYGTFHTKYPLFIVIIFLFRRK